MKTKVLLICNRGKTRSKYLAKYLRELGYNTKWGGVSKSAVVKLTQAKIDWADKIVVSDKHAMKKLKERYNLPKKEISVLEVSDAPRHYPKDARKEFDQARKNFLDKYVHPRLRENVHKKMKKWQQ